MREHGHRHPPELARSETVAKLTSEAMKISLDVWSVGSSKPTAAEVVIIAPSAASLDSCSNLRVNIPEASMKALRSQIALPGIDDEEWADAQTWRDHYEKLRILFVAWVTAICECEPTVAKTDSTQDDVKQNDDRVAIPAESGLLALHNI